MLITAEIILYILTFFIGASVFSFLNVVIYRLPKKLSFVSGRSMCPHCGRMLNWYDMVPVLNWFYLKGKCRNCGAPISFRYPAVELLGGILSCLSIWKYGYTPKSLLIFIFLCVLTTIAFIDYDTMEIPNELVLIVAVLGVLDIGISSEPLWWERLVGVLAVSVPMFVLTLLIPGAFGGGDIKLMAASGIFLGFQMTLLATFLAIVTGGIYGIVLLCGKKIGRKDHFAFGPFLCIGMMAAVFWGQKLLDWYLGFFIR